MAEISSWNLSQIKRDALIANYECSSRGLVNSAKWYAFLCKKFMNNDPSSKVNKKILIIAQPVNCQCTTSNQNQCTTSRQNLAKIFNSKEK